MYKSRKIHFKTFVLCNIFYIQDITLQHKKPFKLPFINGNMATALRDGDYMKHLLTYIEKNLSKGYNVDQLKIVLLSQGYSRAAVEKAMRLVVSRLPKPILVAPPKEHPKIEIPQEEKKPGFFARLFGIGKKKANEDDMANLDLSTGNIK
jgi:hypothetical protein